MTVLALATACGFLCGLSVWAFAASRRRRHERRLQREAVVRAALYQALDGPRAPDAVLDDLGAADRKLLEIKARAVLPSLRGADRESLARLLEARGATRTARHQCDSRRSKVRVGACQLLGDLGSSYAVFDLVPLLDDPRPVVRMASARALGRLGQPSGVAFLLGAVHSRHPLPVDIVADAIQQIRDWPLSVLQPCLSNPSEPTRALAVELLGRYQALNSIDALVGMLDGDPSTEVRVRAARALGRIGSSRAVGPLTGCVHAGPATVRTEAIYALGRLGAAAAVPALRATVLGPSPVLVQAAATALAAIIPQGAGLLQEIADDEHHPARTTARRALAARDPRVAILRATDHP